MARPLNQRALRIGVSACLFHRDPERAVYNGRPLAYVEQSMARWVASQGAIVYVVPEPESEHAPSFQAYAEDLDGVVLAGGVDVAPGSYGEEPLRPEWSGDAVRDAYEIALVRAMIAEEKPVLGVCRGHQLLNVAFGGTLHQDVLTQVAGARVHRDAGIYDGLFHDIEIEPGSWLASVYEGITRATVNTVHHQAIKDPGRGVVVEARSTEDGVIEAMRVECAAWVRGVQWHPEFTPYEPREGQVSPNLLDRGPLLASFLRAAELRRARD